MKDISKAAGLSKVYTGHCLRATAIQHLNDEGYEARHIMFMSDHRNEGSLRSYNSKVSSTQKKNLSSTLSKIMDPPTNQPPSSSQSSDSESPRFQTPAIQEPHLEVAPRPVSESNIPLPFSHSQNLALNSRFTTTTRSSAVVENSSFLDCEIHFHYHGPHHWKMGNIRNLHELAILHLEMTFVVIIFVYCLSWIKINKIIVAVNHDQMACFTLFQDIFDALFSLMVLMTFWGFDTMTKYGVKGGVKQYGCSVIIEIRCMSISMSISILKCSVIFLLKKMHKNVNINNKMLSLVF